MTQALALAEMLRRRGHAVVGAVVGTSRWGDVPALFRRGLGAPVETVESPGFVAGREGHIPPGGDAAPVDPVEHALQPQPRPDLGDAGPDRARRRGQLLRGADGRPLAPPHRRRADGGGGPPVYGPAPGLPASARPAGPAGGVPRLHRPGRCRRLGPTGPVVLRRARRRRPGGAAAAALQPVPARGPAARRVRPGLPHGARARAVAGGLERPPPPASGSTPSRRSSPTRTARRSTFHGLCGRAFLERMAAARGVVCTAGFETVSEAMWLGTPALMVPTPGHYEQRCNAAGRRRGGRRPRVLHTRPEPVAGAPRQP